MPAIDLALHRDNLAFFQQALPDLARAVQAMPKSGRLAGTPDGDVELLVGPQSYFQGGARAFAAKQAEAFWAQYKSVSFELDPKLVDGDPIFESDWVFEHLFVRGLLDDGIEDDLGEAQKRGPEQCFFALAFGIGLGFHLADLLERTGCRHLIVVESQLELLWHSTFTLDWRALVEALHRRGGGLHFVVDGDVRLASARIQGIARQINPAGMAHAVFYVHDMTDHLVLVHNTFRNEGLPKLLFPGGYLDDEFNMIENTHATLTDPASRLVGSDRPGLDVPMMVVGAGPSLDKEIDLLREHRDRMMIISCGSTLPALLQAGIVPDFHVNHERLRIMYDYHRKVADDFDLSGIVLVGCTTVVPEFRELFDEVLHYFRPASSTVPLYCRNPDTVMHHCDPEVSNTAGAFAAHMRFRRVGYLGVDLGTRDPARHHAKGSFSPIVRRFDIEVAGNFGGTVMTSLNHVAVREHTEALIRGLGGEIDFFNCSDGMLIQGARPLRLEDAVKDWPVIDRAAVRARILEAAESFDPAVAKAVPREARIGERIETLLAEIADFLAGVDLSDIGYATEVNARLTRAAEQGGHADTVVRMLRGTLNCLFCTVDYFLARAEGDVARAKVQERLRKALIDMIGLMAAKSRERMDALAKGT